MPFGPRANVPRDPVVGMAVGAHAAEQAAEVPAVDAVAERKRRREKTVAEKAEILHKGNCFIKNV